MSYIGNVPTTAAFPFDQFSGNGSTTAFTLTYAPAGSTSIIVSISGVVQNPNTYSVSGTTITFSPAPPSGTNNIAVLYLGLPVVASMTGTMGFIAGSANNPPIFPTGDTNTGIYFPAADTIGFSEGGTQVGEFDASANFKFNSGYGSVATAYGCRAWVNFNGTGTVAIRASGNVSSITDNGTGDYTVNFTTAMPDANYCVTTSNKYDNADTSFANGVTVVARYTAAFQAGSVRVQTGITSLVDTVAVCVAIFR